MIFAEHSIKVYLGIDVHGIDVPFQIFLPNCLLNNNKERKLMAELINGTIYRQAFFKEIITFLDL